MTAVLMDVPAIVEDDRHLGYLCFRSGRRRMGASNPRSIWPDELDMTTQVASLRLISMEEKTE